MRSYLIPSTLDSTEHVGSLKLIIRDHDLDPQRTDTSTKQSLHSSPSHDVENVHRVGSALRDQRPLIPRAAWRKDEIFPITAIAS